MPCFLVGLLGLEPRTNGLKVRCSNQLSYSPETLSYRRPARQHPGRFAAVKPTKQP